MTKGQRIAELKPSKKTETELTLTFVKIGGETFSRIKGELGEENTKTVMAGENPSQMHISNLELIEALERISNIEYLKLHMDKERNRVYIYQPMTQFVQETQGG